MTQFHQRRFYVPDGKRDKAKGGEPRIILLSFLECYCLLLFCLRYRFSVSGLSITDALFTATSAISVTGLGVVDTGQHFTLAGKILLMCLMQIGGLGQMTLSAVLLYMFGVRLSLRQQALASSWPRKASQPASFGEKIVTFALVAGRLVLFSSRIVGCQKWVGRRACSMRCFILFRLSTMLASLFSDSMMSFVNDPLVSFTLAGLFIFGGLGFTVIGDVWRHWRKGFHFLHIHTKIMLIATPLLLLVGTVLFGFGTSQPQHHGVTTGGQWLAAFFQSASARTAGLTVLI